MKGVITLVVLVLLCSSFVVAAIPTTTPHGFYGTVAYSDGTLISESLEITADLDGELETVVLLNGVYDLVVESESEGGMIYFYVEGLTNSIGNYIFESFEITELDFTTTLVNPTPDTTPVSPPPSSSGGGGGGGSSSSSSTPNDDGVIVLDDTEDEIEEVKEETPEEIEERTGTFLGAVIGFMKTGKGIGLVFGIVVVIFTAVVLVSQKRK